LLWDACHRATKVLLYYKQWDSGSDDGPLSILRSALTDAANLTADFPECVRNGESLQVLKCPSLAALQAKAIRPINVVSVIENLLLLADWVSQAIGISQLVVPRPKQWDEPDWDELERQANLLWEAMVSISYEMSKQRTIAGAAAVKQFADDLSFRVSQVRSWNRIVGFYSRGFESAGAYARDTLAEVHAPRVITCCRQTGNSAFEVIYRLGILVERFLATSRDGGSKLHDGSYTPFDPDAVAFPVTERELSLVAEFEQQSQANFSTIYSAKLIDENWEHIRGFALSGDEPSMQYHTLLAEFAAVRKTVANRIPPARWRRCPEPQELGFRTAIAVNCVEGDAGRGIKPSDGNRRHNARQKPGPKPGSRRPDKKETDIIKAHRHGQNHEVTARQSEVLTKNGRPDTRKVGRVLRAYKKANPGHKFPPCNS